MGDNHRHQTHEIPNGTCMCFPTPSSAASAKRSGGQQFSAYCPVRTAPDGSLDLDRL